MCTFILSIYILMLVKLITNRLAKYLKCIDKDSNNSFRAACLTKNNNNFQEEMANSGAYEPDSKEDNTSKSPKNNEVGNEDIEVQIQTHQYCTFLQKPWP